MTAQLDQVFAQIRDRGNFHTRLDEMPEDLPAFRSQLRALGRREGVRVLTRVAAGTFMAWWPEHEPTLLQQAATNRAIATMFDEHPVTYGEALEQLRREQIRAV